MEKSHLKFKTLKRFTTRRVRGLKHRIKRNNPRKTLKRKPRRFQQKILAMDYYLESKKNFLLSEEENILNRLRRIGDLEFSEKIPTDFEHYGRKDRELALIGLKDMIFQILEANKDKKNLLPDNFESSTISLFDYYLKHTENHLQKPEVIKALFSSLLYLDKEQNIRVFDESFLNNFELSLDFLKVVDFNLYPVKVLDFFEIFFLRVSQTNKDDIKHQEYLKTFKKVFIELDFYLNFNDSSKIYKVYDKFIYCLLMTKSFLKNNNFIKDEIVDLYIENYKNKININQSYYQSCVNFVKEAKYYYDNYLDLLNLNNLYKNGVISIYNINCI